MPVNLIAKKDRFGVATGWDVAHEDFVIGTVEAPTLNGGSYRASIRTAAGRFSVGIEFIGYFGTLMTAIKGVIKATQPAA